MPDETLDQTRRDGVVGDRFVNQVLAVLRRHLQMEVAFVGRVGDGRRWFEFVDADAGYQPIVAGGSDELESTYCGRVLSGQAPGRIDDAQRHPAVADLPVTQEAGIGAHLSVPINTPDGRTYGTLCCFTRLPTRLTDRDEQIVRMFAEVLGHHLEPLAERHDAQRAARRAVSRVLDDGGPTMVLQPIVDVPTGHVWGYEALARFPNESGVAEWFRQAAFSGLSTALESAAVHQALRLLPRLPDDVALAVNVSAVALVTSRSIKEMLIGTDGQRVVLELTEHNQIANQAKLDHVLSELRAAGIRIAVDDAGSGYAGLERILALRPEVLKLDRALVHGVAGHAGRQAMVQAMVAFTDQMGARLVAEGVEESEDLHALESLGVGLAQGYLLGRPFAPSASGAITGADQRPEKAETLGGVGDVTGLAAGHVVQLTDGLEQAVTFADACRHLAGPEIDEDAMDLVRSAIQLHRRAATRVIDGGTGT